MLGRAWRPACVVSLALLAAATGCVRGPRVVEAAAGAPGATRVVVAPMNLGVRLAMDLEDAVEPVDAELIRYFQALGVHVAVIWPADAWGLWREVATPAKGSPERSPEQVAALFARALAEEADFDLIVFPSLIYRDADVSGRFARWDGVRRRIRFRVRSAVPRGIEPPPSALPGG